MKKSFLSLFLLALVGLAGNLTALAQTPEPDGQWKFDDSRDLMAATVGNVTLSPAVMDGASASPATVSEAGIVAAEGVDGSSAIMLPATSALKVERAEGAAASTNYSIMIDLKVPNAYKYDCLFQTSPSNSNDGEVFISKSQIGAGALGGYFGCIWDDVWYRVVLTNSNGSFKLYVNGEKLIDYETTNTRWEIDPSFYLFADEDGEKVDTYISEVAFWETPLTDEDVSELGGISGFNWITDASQIKEGDQFYIISDRAKFAGSTTAKPKAMAPIQPSFAVNWGDMYVYWGDLDKESDGFVWTAEKAGDQWAFLNKENGQYLGNMNEGESDVIFSNAPVGYTLTDLKEGAGRFYMTNDESEHSLHVQGYLRNDRGNNSLAKQDVGDDDYSSANSAQCGYPGRWRFLKLNGDEPVDPRTKISTAEEFVAFAQAVNAGETTLDAYLAADIDLSEYTSPVLVGVNGTAFAGTFDGNGHSITYNYTTVGDYSGLFGFVDGATIRNLFVKGTAKVQGIHFGALMSYVTGTVLVENVVTDVDITGDRGGVTGDGGMIGRLEGTVTFNNCATHGEMGASGTSMYCGFVAYAGNGASILNNCYTTCKLTEGTGTDYCYTFCRGTATYNNCYYLNAVGTKDGGTQITEEMLASGELCYKLNGDQNTIGWYQTLGEDAMPVPFDSHSQVYANGTLRCDGAELPDSPIVYSNTEGQVTKPDHQYGDDGYCTVCGSVKQDEAGNYIITDAKKLNWFAEKVASGATAINAILKADINLSTSDYSDLMIGTETAEYAGIFDGCGHTITYNYALVADKWRGLFAFVRGATIRNLYVEGSAVVTNIHFGALIGRAYGDVLVENVITNVNITGQRSGVTGDGGMLGANYANIIFNNCATLGEMGGEGSSMYSSFSAWSNGTSSTTLNNCYSLCKLTEGTGTGNCFTLTHKSGTVTINNSYYLNLIGTFVGGTQITEEEVANGSLCAKLGNGWYQNIGEDAYPIFDKTHATLKEITEVGYATMYIPTAVSIPEGVNVYTGEYEETWLKLNAVEDVVPAWEPVVLKGNAGIYSFLPAAPTSEKDVDVVFADADLGFENAEDLTTFEVGGLTLSFADGGNTNAPKYYTSGSAARIYGSNSMTISASAPITKIVFTFAGTNYALKSGGYEFSDGTYNLATKTWTGSAESVTLTNTTTSQWRIVSMVVTCADYPDNIEGNVLKGTVEDIDAVGKYVLAQPEGEPVGFYLADGGTIKAGKVYLEDASGVKAFIFEEDDATGIVDVEKTIEDGLIYNLAGQRISKMQKGINIINGKKILK